MTVRFLYKIRGGHVSCRVFVGQENTTLGNAGSLMFTESEFKTIRDMWETDGIRQIYGSSTHKVEFVEEAN